MSGDMYSLGNYVFISTDHDSFININKQEFFVRKKILMRNFSSSKRRIFFSFICSPLPPNSFHMFRAHFLRCEEAKAYLEAFFLLFNFKIHEILLCIVEHFLFHQDFHRAIIHRKRFEEECLICLYLGHISIYDE